MKESTNLKLELGLAIAVVCISIASCISYGLHEKLVQHEKYYQATETLLDSLESSFNWIDRYDGPALEDYYYYRSKINK